MQNSVLTIWDVQTGVIVREIEIERLGKGTFHGDQRTITLFFDTL